MKHTIKFIYVIEQISDNEWLLIRKTMEYIKVKCEDNKNATQTFPICTESDAFFKGSLNECYKAAKSYIKPKS